MVSAFWVSSIIRNELLIGIEVHFHCMSLSIDIIINADQTESTSYLNGFDLKIRIRISLHSFVHSFLL